MPIQLLPHVLSEKIPEDYINLMGHMNIHYYVKIFNQAALNFFVSFGLDEEYLEKNQGAAFALEQHIRYLKEVREGDLVHIYLRALERSEKAIHYMLFMVHDKDDSLAATSEMVSVYIDKNTRTTTKFPKDIAEQIDPILSEHNSLNWDAPVCGVMGPRKI
ncbi:MAG: thioesterase family protein [Chloroflexi bacterium]|jgi:acyl-CoA thioester hydrolase|nr:thioesterase family protein [Chloroflexota bacterium]MBT3668809.1 thioesterase family protein [Chloroflexota bacterium]MBT4003810.1 thioesterase family protein [Chloroflexota bacterium]MBT4306523.1 thioesterase family protein [Chloroflexota bacterium]MBT4533907.1 thioesterase family protein [Chloroflexota bacterium]